MPNPIRNTYGTLSRTLRSLGFKTVRQGDHVVFTHATGRPLILLPAYKSGQAVKPIHLMMVRKQLADVGMLQPGVLVIQPRLRSPKAVKSPLKMKSVLSAIFCT